MKTIYDLKLHEEMPLYKGLDVMRVPGGWIYKDWVECDNKSIAISNTFVPYNDEFKEEV